MAIDSDATSGNPESEPRVLLVDDNTANLQVLRESLDGLGCKLLMAKNGVSALAIVEKAHPDLILLDIMMPEMDGYEVCRRLKANEATRHIPMRIFGIHPTTGASHDHHRRLCCSGLPV
jgi:CheY-like chemotaxis protein